MSHETGNAIKATGSDETGSIKNDENDIAQKQMHAVKVLPVMPKRGSASMGDLNSVLDKEETQEKAVVPTPRKRPTVIKARPMSMVTIPSKDNDSTLQTQDDTQVSVV